MSDQEAVDIIRKESNVRQMANKLIQESLRLGTKDNISVIVIAL